MGGDLLITDLVERSPLQALGSEVVDAPMEIYQREYLIAGDNEKRLRDLSVSSYRRGGTQRPAEYTKPRKDERILWTGSKGGLLLRRSPSTGQSAFKRPITWPIGLVSL